MRNRMVSAAVIAAAGVLAGSAVATAAPSEQDTTWMVGAHQSNLAEIAAGEAALAQATSQDVKDLGQMFIDMHSQLDADLTAAAGQLGVSLPDAPTPSQQASLDQVEAQSGTAFDTAWVAQQIASHETSKAATQQEIAQGSDPTVLGLANTAAPVVQQHLDALQALAAAAGAPSLVPTGDGGLLAGDDAGPGALPWVLAGAGLVLLAGGARVAVAVRRR